MGTRLEHLYTEIQDSPVPAKPLKEPPQITTIYGRTKGKTWPKTTARSKSQRLALGQVKAHGGSLQALMTDQHVPKGNGTSPAPSHRLQTRGCSLSAVWAPESPTRQRPGFPLDPLPAVLPDDEIMALDKTFSFKSTFYPNG